jgi:hypothetical protein
MFSISKILESMARPIAHVIAGGSRATGITVV